MKFSYIFSGLISWDVADTHVDLEEELSTITAQALEGEEGKHGKFYDINVTTLFPSQKI